MKLITICERLTLTGLLLAVAACGDDGGGSSPPPDGPAQVSTLAYVVGRCHEEKRGADFSGSQALWVHRGDQPPVKIAEYALGQPPIGGFCTLFGRGRNGSTALFVGALQRLGVSPDGSVVVFEVTDDFSPFTHVVPPEQQGIFAVHADGSGLEKVADHSNDPAFRVDWRCAFASAPGCDPGFSLPTLEFSPDGRRVVYTDLGPSDTDDEAPQVFTLDLTTKERQQVTHLQRLPECRGQSDDDSDCLLPTGFSVRSPSFLDDTKIAYIRGGRDSAASGGRVFTVKLNANGTEWGEPKAVRVLAPPGGGVVVPIFEITGTEPYAATIEVPGRGNQAFVIELPGAAQRPEARVLQLTNFDSGIGQARMSTDRQRVLFLASADPLGTNPCNQSQWFSIDRLGSDLRQLTSFGAVGKPGHNCGDIAAPGCTVLGASRVDLRTGSVVFSSTCDPLGTNPQGGNQLFALRPDGSGLRQFTYTQGMITNPDRSVDVELPSPFHVPTRLR